MDFDMEVCLYFMKKQMKKLRVSLHGLQIRNLLLDIENKENENRGNPCSSICKLGDEFLIVELQPAVVHISIYQYAHRSTKLRVSFSFNLKNHVHA
jgi:hypothetical protein